MSLSFMNYVSWLHTVENMKLEAAREKARAVFSKQTGELIPLDFVVTPEEYAEMEVQRKLMRSRSIH